MHTSVRKTLAVAVALTATALVLASCDWRGPEPEHDSLKVDGPFDIAQVVVGAEDVEGFGGGTIYYPTNTDEGPYGSPDPVGGVAVAPGFGGVQQDMRWYGPRVASHGFVTILLDTLHTFDLQPARAQQLAAALEYLTEESAVSEMVDPARLAVMGYSMGGGGAVQAAAADPQLKAAIAIAPHHSDPDWPEVETPTLVVGAELDEVAHVDLHAEPIYESLSSRNKAYLELAGAEHWWPKNIGGLAHLDAHQTISVAMVSWLKRFVDGDSRYTKFLCPPLVDGMISEYRSTCPYVG